MAIRTLTLTTILAGAGVALTGGVSSAGLSGYVGPTEGSIYVDASAASSGDGLSLASAYRTVSEAAAVAGPGDVVVVRGGDYPEFVTLQPFGRQGGTAQQPIIYTAYGNETPIIKGGEVVPGTWTICTSAAEAGGNPAFGSIYRVDVPAVLIPDAMLANLHQSNAQMHSPQSAAGYRANGVQVEENLVGPGATDFFDTADAVTTTTLRHTKLPTLFPTDADLAGAFVTTQYNPGNNTDAREITSYDASTGTVTFPAIAGAEALYSISNAVQLIDGPQQYVVGPIVNGMRRLWVWPNESPAVAPIEYCARGAGFDISDRDYIKVRGFTFQQFATTGQGIAVGSVGNASQEKEGIEISDCTVRGVVTSARGGGATALGLSRCYGGSKITHCLVHDCKGAAGIVFNLANARRSDGEVTYNKIFRTTSTSLRPHSSWGVLVAFNDVGRIIGAHGNGASFYAAGRHILAFGNRIETGTNAIPLTHQDSGPLSFICNLIVVSEGDGRGFDNNSSRPAPVSGDIDYAHNTVVTAIGDDPNASYAGLANFANTGNATHHAVSNVFHGFAFGNNTAGTTGTIAGNIVTGLSNGQIGGDPHLGIQGLVYDPDLIDLFVDHAAGDYAPRPGGPLDGTAPDASAVMARAAAIFPTFNLGQDVYGNPVSDWSQGRSIGAVQA